MKQRMIMALTALFTVMGSTFLPRLEAAALTTEQRYHQSRIVMMTTQDNAVLLAEPNKDALVMGYYPKGTLFVPINQSRNETEVRPIILSFALTGPWGGSCQIPWF